MSVDDSREAELTSLLSGATLVFVGTVFGSISKLLERVIVGRALSLDAYGRVSVGIALLTVGSTVALFGLQQGVPRYMSRLEDAAHVRGTWLTGLVVGVGLGTVLAVGLYVTAPFVADRLLSGEEATTLVRQFAVAIPFLAGLHVGLAGLQGMENARYRTYVKDLFYPVARILLLLLLLALGLGVFAAGYAYVLAAAAAAVVAHTFLHRLFSLRGGVTTQLGELLGFSGPLVVATVISALLVHTDTLMLGYFRTDAEVALYAAAYPLAYGLLLVFSAFGFIYLPLASRLDAADSRGELDEIYSVTTKWIFVITFPLFLAFTVFPADALSIVFGARYSPAATALVILSIGFMANAAAGRNRQTLSALGRTKVLMVATTGTYALNVGLNLLLIPRYGHVGAAVASASSYAALNVAVCAFLATRMGVSPLSMQNVRTYVALPAVLVPAAFLASRYVELTAATILPFLVASGLCSLAVLAAVGGLQPEDTVPLSYVEDRTGVRLSVLHRYIPDDG